MAAPLHATLDQASQAPIPAGFRSAELMRHGSMALRYYAPAGGDPQAPHDQDEIYIVASGRGTFACGGRRVDFGPGDALFAPAGADHRFESFSADFGTWVVFYGPKGGEHG
jgi:mannose-6-phosphate isomerase-like protein (cupin superfamily)